MAKTWTDQPDSITEYGIIATIRLREEVAEIRRDQRNGFYYLTVGNLFRSQTLEAPNADLILVTLGRIGVGLVPDGVTIL